MEEIIIDSEDPGMKIMRKVIARKEVWKQDLSTFKADVYCRTTLYGDTSVALVKENNPSLLDAIESIDNKIEEKTVNEELASFKYIKIKIHSKTNAIDQINKMMGYHEPEKINSDINIIVTRVKKPPIDER